MNNSRAATPRAENFALSLSPAQILLYCLLFVLRNFPRILKRSFFPLALGCAILYGILFVYCAQLAAYLEHPLGSIGNRVLGVAAAGLLIMVFLHSMISASIAEVVLGRKIPGGSFLGVRPWEWRLYVSNLKFLLALVLSCVAFWFLSALMARSLILPQLLQICGILFGAVLFWLLVRGWYFLLPVCVDSAESEAISKSWRMSAGHFWSLTAILLPIFFLAYVTQIVGEVALRFVHLISATGGGLSLLANLYLLQRNLLPLVVLVGAIYFLAATLAAAARIETYRRLIGH